MVDTPCEGIRCNKQLNSIFESKIADWSNHLPIMYSFGDSILFGTADYHENPLAKHTYLSVEHVHFERWI